MALGSSRDWMKWARGIDTPEHHEDVPSWEKYFGVSMDHKVIGIQYTITALVLIAVGGYVRHDLPNRAGRNLNCSF